MYKHILCWRYLKTRYLAFACIVSVMLGVATLIVVNSVMNGFSTKLRDLLHNVMSDISIEGNSQEGMFNPTDKIAKIRKDPYLDEQIESMAITMESFAMVQFRNHNGEIATRPVRVFGIELKSRSDVGGFHEHLKSYEDAIKKGETPPAATFDIPVSMRNNFLEAERHLAEAREREHDHAAKAVLLPPMFPAIENEPNGIPKLDPVFFPKKPADPIPPPMPVPHVVRIPQGAIVGNLIAKFNYTDPDTGELKQGEAIKPGENIVLTTVNSGETLKPVYDTFVVVDFFKSGMSEYDANCVFIPLEHLQTLRGMDNRASRFSIKLKDYREAGNVVKKLAKLFENERLGINTWEQKQGPLLRAIEIEKSILNILLFMIIAVAGFGILAIFSMIVSEKTRDIGILKALGASRAGILQIFLTYGLLLGVVGAGLGTILGLTITLNINEIEAGIAVLTGSKLFNEKIYYFNEIPTDVKPAAVFIVNLGAIAIATVFSILPALWAAKLHPVQASRYE